MGLIKRPNELTVKTTLSALIYGQPGMGKAQPLYCNILTPTGFKKLSDLSVGDEVMGHDGKVQKVLGIYPQGIRPVYRIMTNDSAITYCDEEHIWTVRSSTGNSRKAGFKNVTLKEMIAKGISCPLSPSRQSTTRKAIPRYEIPVAEAMDYPEKEYEVNPYIWGVLIGDGSLTGNVAMFSILIWIIKYWKKSRCCYQVYILFGRMKLRSAHNIVLFFGVMVKGIFRR